MGCIIDSFCSLFFVFFCFDEVGFLKHGFAFWDVYSFSLLGFTVYRFFTLSVFLFVFGFCVFRIPASFVVFNVFTN
jgi:hypothetical protein